MHYPTWSATNPAMGSSSSPRMQLSSSSTDFINSANSSRYNSPNITNASLDETPHHNAVPFEHRERIFKDKSLRLLSSLSDTKKIVEVLKELNRSEWTFRYPLKTISSSRPHNQLRSNTVHGTSSGHVSLISQATSRPRSNSFTLTSADAQNSLDVQKHNLSETQGSAVELDILSLDVKVGNHTNHRIMDSLEHNSISNLFEDRLAHSINYLDKLSARVSDNSSKLLVTGDLNSGKSTFINALLKRKVMPTDQQPCTMLFCEVLSKDLNNGVEEAHAIPSALEYNREDPSTFDKVDIRHLSKTVAEDFKAYELVKVYCHNRQETETMLNNGTLDITLIDSPGLNRDSLKTTQLFARQEEIDVVVFVVHAENQFTLSGQEFLQSAGKEKAYIFIVINRFDTIRDKKRCRRQILEQIKKLSPRTYEDESELVHFVAAEECFDLDTDIALPNSEIPDSFQRLEGCLRSFILEKRSRSKLAPAKRFILNVLTDVLTLAKFNLDAADKQSLEISTSLEKILPQYETTLEKKDLAAKEATELVKKADEYAKNEVERSIGLLIANIEEFVPLPTWPGVFGAMTYVEDLKLYIQSSLRKSFGEAEQRVASSSFSTYQYILALGSKELKNESIPQYPVSNVKSLRDEHLRGISITWFELFDVKSKLAYFSFGFSSLGFAGAQLIGSQQLTLFAYNFVSGLDLTKVLLLGTLSISGVAIAFLGTTDLQSACNQKVIAKAKCILKASCTASKAGEESSAKTRSYLQGATGRLCAAYTTKLRAQEAEKSAHLDLQRIVGAAQTNFNTLITDAKQIITRVEAISTEDSI